MIFSDSTKIPLISLLRLFQNHVIFSKFKRFRKKRSDIKTLTISLLGPSFCLVLLSRNFTVYDRKIAHRKMSIILGQWYHYIKLDHIQVSDIPILSTEEVMWSRVMV